MEWKDWDRRHGGYRSGGVRDVWLWSPDVPHLLLDLPLTRVVLDTERRSIELLVANCSSGYPHPCIASRSVSPRSAPLGCHRDPLQPGVEIDSTSNAASSDGVLPYRARTRYDVLLYHVVFSILEHGWPMVRLEYWFSKQC